MNIKPCKNLSNLKHVPGVLKEVKYVANSSCQCYPFHKMFTANLAADSESKKKQYLLSLHVVL